MSDLACTSMAEETPYKGPMVVRFYPGQPTERSIEMKYRITGPKDVEREVVLELVQERSSGEVRLTAQVDGTGRRQHLVDSQVDTRRNASSV